MRTSLVFLALLAADAVNAQSPNPVNALESRPTTELRENLIRQESAPLNRILGERFIYSGIVVELLRAENPLQLFNPLAPPEYGDAEQNVSRDPITGKVTGLKLFSVNF